MRLKAGTGRAAVGEGDGDLGDAQALAPDFMSQFDLEAVSVRVDVLQVDGLERRATEALEPARRIGEGHARDQLHVAGGAEAQEQPAQGPVDDANPLRVTRTQHQIRMSRRIEESGNIVRIVGQIAIHLEEELVGPL